MAVPRKQDRPLRRDVRLLGELLGSVIAEQEGFELLELEERVRRLSIRRRRGPREERATATRELTALLAGLPEERIEPIVRAFAAYFQLVNLAEQHHRIRRARAHASGEHALPQRGSLKAALLEARRRGIGAGACRSAIAALEVTLTFTAHPTQAIRRTVLEKLYRIAQALEERDRGQLTPQEQEETLRRMREEICALWQTDELRRERPTVGDEVKNVVWYLEAILWDALPRLGEALGEAFQAVYGEPLGFLPAPLHFHSWVGGDMDGHPGVTPEVLEDAIRAYRNRGVRRLLSEVGELGGALSQSSRRMRAPQRLLDSIAEDAARMPAVGSRRGGRGPGAGQGPGTQLPVHPERSGAESKGQNVPDTVVATRTSDSPSGHQVVSGPSTPDLRSYAQGERRQKQLELEVDSEPWRRKLRFVEARLLATLRHGEFLRGERAADADPAVPTYATKDALAADLRLIAETLHEAGGHSGGERRVHSVLQRVEALGLQIAELELRVHAGDARAAAEALASGRAAEGGGARFLASLEKIARAQSEAGEAACRTVILSMASEALDVQAALACARAKGLWDEARGCAKVDVVPLFETLGALEGAGAILEALFADPTYGAHVRGRGAQEVMVGYSDSGKEVGLLAASAALWRAQRALPAIAAKAGVRLRIFHGRGESVARGGGPAQQAILALPPGSVGGRYKATEQGEALDHKYARPELAMRTLELIVGGALLHSLDAQERPSPDDEARFEVAYQALAEDGRRAYRALVWDDARFPDFFRAVTPVEEISQLPMGSRPSKRHAGGLEALRAIPWVFAWTQNRAILPGWYGVGSALAAFGAGAHGPALLSEMYERWPFFRAVIDNVEMVLAKSDLPIAERYVAELAPEALRPLWKQIVEEHARTVAWVKRLTGHRRLLDGNPSLQRTIALRNPYVDPMSFLQVELLRRKRGGHPENRPLLLTLSGIAAGMRNTG